MHCVRVSGPGTTCCPGVGSTQTPSPARGTDQSDTILVGTGSNRVFRAEEAISRHSGETLIQVRPGGLPGTWPGGLRLINRLGIARKTRQVLQAAPGFRLRDRLLPVLAW
jgi:hypothetical protein